MSVTQLFFLCLCATTLFASENYVVNNFPKRNSARYCGQNLVHALQLVCNGVYHRMFYKKSSANTEDWRQADYGNDSPEYPFKQKTGALTLITRALRRTRRGITDECCRVGCNIAELSNYCGGYD